MDGAAGEHTLASHGGIKVIDNRKMYRITIDVLAAVGCKQAQVENQVEEAIKLTPNLTLLGIDVQVEAK